MTDLSDHYQAIVAERAYQAHLAGEDGWRYVESAMIQGRRILEESDREKSAKSPCDNSN